MNRKLNQILISVTVLILAAVFGYLLPLAFSSNQQTAKQVAAEAIKPVTSGKAHSVIYRVREYHQGQLQSEKIYLRSVNEQGEWRKEAIWPLSDGGIEQRIEGQYAVSQNNKKLIGHNGLTVGSYFQPLSEGTRQTAEVKEIAGVKAYHIHSESGDSVFDEYFSDKTGKTPLWSRIFNQRTGVEINSEALHIIWGVKDF